MLFAPGEHEVVAQGGRHFIVRPVEISDEAALVAMFSRASPEDVRFRAFGAVKDFAESMARRLTGIDPARETTLVAMAAQAPDEILGAVHVVSDPLDPGSAEFDVMVRGDLKGHGLGYRLMLEILAHARQRGLRTVEGYILAENRTMLKMAGELGFEMVSAEGGVVRVKVDLTSRALDQALRPRGDATGAAAP